MDALVQRLVQNPHDQDAILRGHSAGQQDPRSYAMLLEKVGTATSDPALASHWLTEAANVWRLSLNDAHRAARALMIAIDRDPTQPAPAEHLAELYREKGDTKALVALLERRAKALAPLSQRDLAMRAHVAGIHEELGRLWAEAPLANPAKAMESYRRALDYDPMSHYAIYAIREAHKAAGRVADAIPYYAMEQALVEDPERKVSLYADEAEVRRSMGDLNGALRSLDDARHVDASDAGLKQQLAMLVLDSLREGKSIDEVWKRAGAELFVELSEEYPGELGYAYSTCALAIEPGNHGAIRLALDYGTQLGRAEEIAPFAARYLKVNPTSPLAAEAKLVAGRHPIPPAPLRRQTETRPRGPNADSRPTDTPAPETPAIRAFISYTQESKEHRDRVVDLAQRLRGDGIDAWLDQFLAMPPEGWPRWSRNELEAADFVLIVCTERYRDRFEGREPGGANWEGYLVESALYHDDARNLRYIPLLFDGHGPQQVPTSLKPTTHYSLPLDYERLLLRLTTQPPAQPAPIGELRGRGFGDARDDPELRALREEEKRLAISGGDTEDVRDRILIRRRQLRDSDDVGLGTRLANGRYELAERVKHGGFATVWKAWDNEHNRIVAIKILHRQHVEDFSRRDRFFRGARQMARLSHPAIVRVLQEAGQEGTTHYFVMEFVAGGDLGDAVTSGRIRPSDAVSVLLSVGGALEFAHGVNVIHRDVKPANIMAPALGALKLTDFDLVHAPDTTGGTQTGGMGTLGFAAPELMKDAKRADPRMDIYSLGMVGQFILYGHAFPIDVLTDARAFRDTLAWPPRLRPVIERACEPKPENRYASIAEFREALRAC